MLGIVSLGGCLEFYDFAVFVFFTSVLSEVFFPDGLTSRMSNLQVWGIFAAGYVFRPFGGLVLAHFGDIFGRKRVFAFSILLMASSTLGIAFLPTYAMVGIGAPLMLLVLRAIQGIAIGGEVPGAWVFAAEHMTIGNRGVACGAICGGLAIGILLASLTATAITSILSPDDVSRYGWRLPFLLGGLFGLLSLRLRRMLVETPAFARSQVGKPLVAELPLRRVLQTQLRAIILSIVATWVLSGCVVVLALLMPGMLHEMYGYTHEQALIGSCVSTFFLALGLTAAGFILDKIGVAAFLICFGMLLGLSTFVFGSIGVSGRGMFYLLCAVIGLSGSVSTGAPYLMVSAFPVGVRYTGVSVAYNVAYAVFGGLTPIFISAMSYLTKDPHIYYLVGISMIAVALGGYITLRPLPVFRE
jgi:predicted MFS family arabinose efflux permease